MSAKAPFNATARPAAAAASLSPQRSPWHSPVPYLFGGLAAMLGLIAFALLILACSYWKLSGYLDGDSAGAGAGDRDLESGDGDDSAKKSPPVFEEKILVIMAGQAKPTFLATPASSRTSSFGDNGTSCVCKKSTDSSPETAETEKSVEVSGDRSEADLEEQSSVRRQTH